LYGESAFSEKATSPPAKYHLTSVALVAAEPLPHEPHDVRRLLPTVLSPCAAPCTLPGTSCESQERVGTGGFCCRSFPDYPS
jgi:hypothetical protein